MNIRKLHLAEVLFQSSDGGIFNYFSEEVSKAIIVGILITFLKIFFHQ